MSTEFNHDGSITVIGYSLPEFCFELCDLAAKGFTVTQENDKAVSGVYRYWELLLCNSSTTTPLQNRLTRQSFKRT